MHIHGGFNRPAYLPAATPAIQTQRRHVQNSLLYLDHGIRSVICLQPSDERDNADQPFVPYEPVLTELARSRHVTVSYQQHPIEDMGTPTPDGMSTILDSIDASIHESRPGLRPLLGRPWKNRNRSRLLARSSRVQCQRCSEENCRVETTLRVSGLPAITTDC
jgi:hypothetical protein